MAGLNLWGSLRIEFGEPAGPPISIGFLAGGSMHQLRRVYGLIWRDGVFGMIRTGPFEDLPDDEAGDLD